LEREKTLALSANQGDFEALMSISPKAIENLNFWLTPSQVEPRTIKFKPFYTTIFSDASKLGWGAHHDTQRTGGRWLPGEATAHINWLELYACFLAIKSFASNLREVHIALKLDNTCAIHYINNQGGTVECLNDLAKDMWLWCKSRKLTITASHIPGVDNKLADFNSRNFKDNTEWSLKKEVFNLIINHFGKPDVDLFASRLNNKIDQYISWQPDPNSIWVDAFTLNWGNFTLPYAFPPFNLIGKVINKAVHEKVNLLLVAPHWTTQYWFPLIYEFTSSDPLPLPLKPDTVCLEHNLSMVHPIWNKLNLMCFRLTAKR
jgi:hypothetical protein